MDGISLGFPGCPQDGGFIEIAFHSISRPNIVGQISQLHVQGVGISFRVNSYSFNIKLLTSSYNAYGNLATVGNKDTFEHKDCLLVYNFC